jgi:hypothetical protein
MIASRLVPRISSFLPPQPWRFQAGADGIWEAIDVDPQFIFQAHAAPLEFSRIRPGDVPVIVENGGAALLAFSR